MMILQLIIAIAILLAFAAFSILSIVAIAWVHHPYGIRNYYKHCKKCSHSLAVGNHPPCLECEDGSEYEKRTKDDFPPREED